MKYIIIKGHNACGSEGVVGCVEYTGNMTRARENAILNFAEEKGIVVYNNQFCFLSNNTQGEDKRTIDCLIEGRNKTFQFDEKTVITLEKCYSDFI